MRSLFIISIEPRYGGAERSIEVVAEHLQRDVKLTIFAYSSSKHFAALKNILRPPSRVIRFRLPRSRDVFSVVKRGAVGILRTFISGEAAAFIDRVATMGAHTGHLARSIKAFDSILSAARLLLYIAAFRPDAILTNTNFSAKIVAAVAHVLPRISRRTFIYVRDFMWTDFDRLFRYLGRAHVLIPGPALLDRPDYLANHLVPRGTMQWSIVGNAVCLPTQVTRSNTTDGYVLHLATVIPFKGHYHLIRTAALLRDRGVPMRFISRGSMADSALWSDFHGLIFSWGLIKLFALWDAVEDPSEDLAGCLCVVVASISDFGGPETFGRTIIEAWAHGKPVVAFDAGGAHYLIEHEHDGLLVPEGNVEALADALQLLAQRPNLCRRLGENGLDKVRRSFTPDKIVRDLRAVLQV